MISEAYIREELKQVKDPEIPTISIVDLGIVTGVKIENKDVHVTLTPTFAGCPALRLMEDMVKDHLNANMEVFSMFSLRLRFCISHRGSSLAEVTLSSCIGTWLNN